MAREQTPTLGRIVIYRLDAADVDLIQRRREDLADRRDARMGAWMQAHGGNPVSVGQAFPAVIVAVDGDQAASAVNLKVLLDGNDDLWVSSRKVGDGPGQFAWPQRA